MVQHDVDTAPEPVLLLGHLGQELVHVGRDLGALALWLPLPHLRDVYQRVVLGLGLRARSCSMGVTRQLEQQGDPLLEAVALSSL